jgi:hypothetical protein
MSSQSTEQRGVCLKFGAACLRSDDRLKIGISRTFDPAQFPINGLRHPPQGDTTGWYFWSGEESSIDAEFFVPLHAFHLSDRCPEIVKYFGSGRVGDSLLLPDMKMHGLTRVC